MITTHKGKPYFEYDGKRFVFNSKPFNTLVNRLRRDGTRVFEGTLKHGGLTYAANPITTGRGSRNPLVVLDTKLDGTLSRKGQADLDAINQAWEDLTAFLKPGHKYFVSMDFKTSARLINRRGDVHIEYYTVSTSERDWVATRRWTRAEVIDRLFEDYRRKFMADSEPKLVKVITLKAVEATGTNLEDVPMGSVKMLYRSLDNNLETRPGSCLIDYILSEFHKPDTRLNYITRPWLETFFAGRNTTRRVIELAEHLETVSVYALDPMFQVFKHHVAAKQRATLMFMVNDSHCYAISDTELRRKVVAAAALNLHDTTLRVDFERAAYCDEPNFMEAIAESTQHIVIDTCAVERSLDEIGADIMNTSGHYSECLLFGTDGHMTAFRHPTKDIMVIDGSNFRQRRDVCERFYNKFRVGDYKWKNQGWGQIGRMIHENTCGSIPRSSYSVDIKKILEDYAITAYCVSEEKEASHRDSSVDITRCYSSILLENEEAYPVYSIFDMIEPFACTSAADILPGEYYVDEEFFMGNLTIRLVAGFYPHVLIKYALENGYLEAASIKFRVVANQKLPADSFKRFVELVMEEFPDAESKKIVNMFVGCLGSLYHRTSHGGITSDGAVAVATAEGNPNIKIHMVDDKYYLQEDKEVMKDGGDLPIYRHVIAASYIKLDRMVKALRPERVIGYTTDSIKIRGKFNRERVFIKKEECAVGDYHLEDTGKAVRLRGKSMYDLPDRVPYVHTVDEVKRFDEGSMSRDDLLDKLLDGGLVMGMPGVGKTELIRSLHDRMSEEERERTVFVAYLAASTENLKARGVPAQTVSSLLWRGDRLASEPLAKYTRVVLDEFTMLPPDVMGHIVNGFIKYGVKIIAFGDPDQCKAPVDAWIAYESNRIFLRMCGNLVVNAQYKKEFARYDESLYRALLEFKATKLLNWPCDRVKSWRNLCLTNKTRNRVNAECFAAWVEEHDAKVVQFGMNLCIGLPVMAYDDHIREIGVFKTQVWTVQAVGKTITLEREGKTIELDKPTFNKVFDYSFAMTVQKCQGITIHEPYNILEASQMSADVLYTALSRGTTRSHVHIDSVRRTPYKPTSRERVVETKIHPENLKVGRIYRIDMEDGSVYVGRTEQTLEERFAQHLHSPTNEDMLEALTPLAKITLLDEFKFSKTSVFADIEQTWIRRAVEDGARVLNSKHNTQAAVKVAPVKHERTTIHIREDESKRCFVIAVARKSFDAADQGRKRFYWGSNKEAAMDAAKAWRDYLMSKYF